MSTLLAPRTKQVRDLIAHGKGNREIMDELGMSARNFKNRITILKWRYKISHDFFRIKLTTAIVYEEFPDLVPFSGGSDRATKLGMLSAADHVEQSQARSRNFKHPNSEKARHQSAAAAAANDYLRSGPGNPQASPGV